MTDNILVPIDLADQETGLKVIREGVIQTKARDGELTVMTVVPDLSCLASTFAMPFAVKWAAPKTMTSRGSCRRRWNG